MTSETKSGDGGRPASDTRLTVIAVAVGALVRATPQGGASAALGSCRSSGIAV